MAKVREEEPSSITKYIESVEKRQSTSENTLWYRGCGEVTHKLLPRLYRHRTAKDIAGFARLETQLMTRFRQRSIPFHDRSLVDDWDTIFFMQHYGVPTRLLDWTENPFIAFYFAVMSALFRVSKTNELTFPQAAAIWILDPVIWNRHALSHQSFDGAVLAPGDDALKGYKPTSTFDAMFNHPVALYGTHNSTRIVAQRGVFTIFGQNTRPMEDIYDSQSFPKDCLIKIILHNSLLAGMRKSILNYGITESVVFPDLEGLAKEIRRIFGFEV
ncbi:MAG: FRG domain-containing protein [candidate division Zixibacteria bacterium]|nr:FRG domain-containing protein [candidate division Zixibacteria bacterium]